MTPPPAARKRILIGAPSFADARTALDLAARLADSLAAELGGVLLEEALVGELLGRPGQRVVTPSGALMPAPSPERLRALADSDVKAFRAALREMAALHRQRWSFERRRGELIAGLCEAAAGWDILLLGCAARPARRGRVVLVAPPAGAPDTAQDVARAIARALRAELATLALAGTGRAAAETLTWADETELLRWLGRASAAAVVVDVEAGPFHGQSQLRQLVAVARCPVVVLGAASAAGDRRR